MSLLPPAPVPEISAERLTSRQHHLRRELSGPGRRRSRRVLVTALSATAVVALIIGLLTGLELRSDSGAPAAGQDRYPASISEATRTHVEAQCRKDPVWHPPLSATDSRAFIGRARVVALDRQGSYYSVVLAEDDTFAVCTFQDDRAHPYTSGGYDGPRKAPSRRPSGSGIVFAATNLSSSGDRGRHIDTSFLIGRAGPDVADVALRLKDGALAHASLSSEGWWQARDPDIDATSIKGSTTTIIVTDVDGRTHTTRLTF